MIFSTEYYMEHLNFSGPGNMAGVGKVDLFPGFLMGGVGSQACARLLAVTGMNPGGRGNGVGTRRRTGTPHPSLSAAAGPTF